MVGARDTNNCDYTKDSWDNCFGKCHPDGVSCRGARKTVHTGYHKVALNKFNNQYCKNGWIYGTKRIGEHIGACSAFNK